jgi:hypothetical protein
MKTLQEHLMEAMSVNEKKITDIHGEIAFWEDPKTEKEIIKKTGLMKEFVHDAVTYLATAVKDTLEFGDPDDWSIDATIEYFTDGDFVEHFTEENWVYKKWGGVMISSNEGDLELDDAAELFGRTAFSLIEKRW